MSSRRCLVVFVMLLGSCAKGGLAPTSPGPTPTPQCSLSVASIDFGPVMVGAHRDTTFLLTNSGTGTLTGTLTDTSSVFTVLGPSSYRLAPGQSTSFTIRFTPVQVGVRSASITAGACVLAAHGTGMTQAVLACDLTTTSIDFGTVTMGQVVDRTFTLTNHSAVAMSGMLTDTSSAFTVPGTSSYNLAPGQGATFIVRFTASRSGPQSCVIATNEPGCPSVSCTATVQSLCAIAPDHLDFGIVPLGSVTRRLVVLENTGPGTLAGTVPAPACNFAIEGAPFPYVLSPGQSLTLTVDFQTGIGEGPYECVIPLGNAACEGITCTGTAEIPCDCAVNPWGFAFGDVVVGEQAVQQFSISASGQTLIGGTMTVLGSGYLLSDGLNTAATLDYYVNGGTSRSFSLIFQPERLGVDSAKVAITQTACTRLGSPCDTLRCIGTGIITPPPPVCAVSTTDIFLGAYHSGQVKDTTFTLTNTGGGMLSGSIRFIDSNPAPFLLIAPTTYSLGAGQSQTFTVRFTAPAVPTGYAYSYARSIDLGTACVGVGPVVVNGTAIP